MKLYLIVAAIVIFTFFSNDFGLVDIQKTAVILAAGIDKTEEGFSLTAQIAVPKGSDRTTGGTSSVNIQSEGGTVSDCVSYLFAKTGWVPKLVFCNLLVIGEDAAKEADVVADLNYFLRNEYMPDSCLVAVCEGKAEKLISSQSAIDDTSSLAIAKLFSDAAEKSGRIMKNTLKDFAIGYFGVSKCGYLPYIRAVDQQGEQAGGSGSGSGSSGETGGSGGGSEPQKIYTAEETAIFSEGKMVGLLTPEETLVFSLLESKVFAGTISTDQEGEPITLTILKDKGGIKLDTKELPKVKLSIEVRVRLCCRSSAAPIEDISDDTVPDDVLANAQDMLKEHVQSLWNKCIECGCDLFHLKRDLYRSSLKKYNELGKTLLEDVTPEFDMKVTSMK